MINSNTKFIGLLGHPVSHSKSAQMHNQMFEILGLNYRYLAFDVEPQHLRQAVEGIRALGLKGANVTIPHKVTVMDYLDGISEEARMIGAVNTITNESGKLIGYNTDGYGYVRSLTEEMDLDVKDKSILIIGAGGAARAISYTLSTYGIKKMTIINRDVQRANTMVSGLMENTDIKVGTYKELSKEMMEADIVINTTSVGMSPMLNDTPIPIELIRPYHIVSDIIYNPLETKLLKDAKNQGAKTHGGLGMFIYQGVIAFEKWTGITPDANTMRETVLKLLR